MMMPLPGPMNALSPKGDVSFSRTLRFELADEENRALLGSYAISVSIGVAFLLLQQFGPRAVTIVEPRPADTPPIVVGILGGPPEPTVIESLRNAFGGRGRGVLAGRPASASPTTSAAGASEINAAFKVPAASGTGGHTGDAGGLLRGVAVKSGAGAAGSGGKTVLEMGAGGQGSVIPGRGGISGGIGSGTSSVGAMGKGTGSGVTRSAVVVSDPAVIPVAALPPDARNVGDVGTFVRGREAELRFCYEENGLKVNPDLGGSITVALTIAGSGNVTTASVTRRTWSGRGAAEAEACILRAARGWRLPASERGAGTYSFPFSFTR